MYVCMYVIGVGRVVELAHFCLLVALPSPLGPLLFCLSVHSLISNLTSEFKVFNLDEGILGGHYDVRDDLLFLGNAASKVELVLNQQQCEFIANEECPGFSAFTFSRHLKLQMAEY